MPSLEDIMHLLNGARGGDVFDGLRAGFLVLLALAVAGVAWPARGAGPRRAGLLAAGLWAALAAVLAHQALWQLAGFRRPEFVRFIRFHDPRPDAALKQVQRGQILDWRGTVLAATDVADPWHRIYPLGPAACHVVGYLHPRYGMAGVERAADPTLCGYSFRNLGDLDRFGRNLVDHRGARGGDVRLTLDAELQRAAAGLLAGRAGAAVVLRPDDGSLLALASAPVFDPQNPGAALSDAAGAPLLNRATQGLYPPGSTFKILLAGMAAERRLAPRLRCPGEGFAPVPGTRPIRDSEYYVCLREGRAWPGFGRIGLRDGFVHSSNVYFAQLALLLGAERFDAIAERNRLRERVVCFDGPAAALATEPGRLPAASPAQRRELAQRAIGQGDFLVTPLHVALWTAAVAAHGRMWQPRLAADAPPLLLGHTMPAAAADTVRDLMRESVRYGTGRAADIPRLAVCGKTGTAEAPGGTEHSWFTCFAPAGRPELVVTVLIEHGGYGARSAAPVARGILEAAVELGLAGEDPRETK
jgi:peptidoglycan glycosyltransferase